MPFSREFNVDIQLAKDCGSLAVLISVVIVAGVWGIAIIERITGLPIGGPRRLFATLNLHPDASIAATARRHRRIFSLPGVLGALFPATVRATSQARMATTSPMASAISSRS